MNRYLIQLPRPIIASGQTWYSKTVNMERIEIVDKHPDIKDHWLVYLKNLDGEIGVKKWLVDSEKIYKHYTLDTNSPLIQWIEHIINHQDFYLTMRL